MFRSFIYLDEEKNVFLSKTNRQRICKSANGGK